MTYAKTIAASGSYDIPGDTMRVHDVQVTNQGPGIVYYGDLPPPAITLTMNITSGNSYLDLLNAAGNAEGTLGLLIEPGMTAADNSGDIYIPASTQVVSVSGTRVVISAAALSTGTAEEVVFTAPAISSTNGHPIQVGETVRFSAGAGAQRNQRARRIVADGSGAVLTISASRA